jgi:hypothetical protein
MYVEYAIVSICSTHPRGVCLSVDYVHTYVQHVYIYWRKFLNFFLMTREKEELVDTVLFCSLGWKILKCRAK